MSNYNTLHVDTTNCDTEPIHLIGRIQPHGFLLIFHPETLQVEQASQNIGQYLPALTEEVLGKPITALCQGDEAAALEHQLTLARKASPQLLQFHGKQFFGFLHASGKSMVLECEPLTMVTGQQSLDHSLAFGHFQAELNALQSLSSQADLLVSFVQRILDYDRVMLYVFDQDWHGEVIAEKKVAEVRSYLHHHFPASDIPEPARALLTQKHIRQIPDVLAGSVEIVPYLNPNTGSPSGILQSELRNPSELHLEYLQNMGVHATLSFSIMVNNKLWGLVAGHHGKPRFTSYWSRLLCHLAALAFSNAVVASRERRDLQTLETLKRKEALLIRQVDACSDLFAGLLNQEEKVLHLTEGQGVAIYYNNTYASLGQTPDQENVMEIIDWLSQHNTESVFHTRELSRHMPAAASYSHTASGLLALAISPFNKEYVLFFKPEIMEKRVWAGNPDKPAASSDLRVHPRQSFNQWEEIIKGKSLPWSLNDVDIAQILLKDISGLLYRNQANLLKDLNHELEASADELRTKNSRLEDFAHIITHNLRSPMSNIQGLYNLYKEDPSHETGTVVIGKMHQMIQNMSGTLKDLNTILSMAIEQNLPQTKLQVRQLIDKQLQNLHTSILTSQATIETDLQVNELMTFKVYFESILHNLLSNALKYRSDDRAPHIRISTWREGGQFCLAVRDNGLGMDLQKVGNRVFGLYNTFHRNRDSKGLGLYLTKMHLEALGGHIEVESAPNKGTTFTVRLKDS
ncbi:ATP-binding protein [Pontibacter sp. E15-1]|uniref:ATP-binding protein n=1 Tax=Pontibacter sp. E15-1 TaxID=2919918 RepID=UPI001F4F33CD|nr:ATP-binding protein [Pontibacter sp. E15-1]MCJ8166279.1 ATP-binding protein [Pontibacter sp. E15-1]